MEPHTWAPHHSPWGTSASHAYAHASVCCGSCGSDDLVTDMEQGDTVRSDRIATAAAAAETTNHRPPPTTTIPNESQEKACIDGCGGNNDCDYHNCRQ